jgi:hypothetical protein
VARTIFRFRRIKVSYLPSSLAQIEWSGNQHDVMRVCQVFRKFFAMTAGRGKAQIRHHEADARETIEQPSCVFGQPGNAGPPRDIQRGARFDF